MPIDPNHEQRQDDHLVRRFHAETEGDNCHHDHRAVHPLHRTKQRAREPEPMKQPKEERHPQPHPPVAVIRPHDVLHRDEHDAQGNQWLHDALGNVNEVERRQREGNRVRQREGGDELEQFPQRRRAQNERGNEQQVIVSGIAHAEDMADAVDEIVFEDPAAIGRTRRRAGRC